MTWASRPDKARMRDYLLAAAVPFRHAIFLPGWDEDAEVGCLCVERALQLGSITRSTKLIAVERNLALVDRIGQRLRQFPFTRRPSLHIGELHDLQFRPDDRIDFAMLDFLGTLDYHLAYWFTNELGPHLTPHATIGITLTHTWRNNRFMDLSAYAWRTNMRWRQMALDYATRHGITNRYILLHLVILRSVLYQFDYTYRQVQLYQDTARTMIAYRLDALTPLKKPHWPSADEVLASIKEPVL